MSDQQLIETTRNSLPSLSSRVMFWRPRFMADSPWLEHIPFYFWLIEAQQPELVFDPDVTSGSTYFALCQAVDKLNTETLCMAGFHSQCQQQEAIARYNEDHYQEFSILSPERALDSIKDIDDGSLDLLVLKYNSPLILKQKSGKSGEQWWEKKLSDSAIVLVHGSQKKEIKPLCRWLKKNYSTFEFVHGNGLLVVAAGKQQSVKIQSLMSLGTNRTGARIMQDVYSRLGLACRESWFSVNGKKQLKALELELSQTREELASHEQEKAAVASQYQQACQEREAAQQQNHKLQNSVELRFDELAKLTTLLNQTETELQRASVEQTKLQQALEQSLTAAKETRLAEIKKLTDQLKNEQDNNQKAAVELTGANQKLAEQDKLIKRLEQNNQLLEADQKQAALTIEELKQEHRRLEQSLQQRFDELAILTSMLEEKEQQIKRQPVTGTEEKSEAKASHKKRLALNFNVLGKRQAAKAKLKEKIVLIEQSGLFDIQWYTKTYPAAAKYKAGAIAHYLILGANKGHNPSPDFNSSWYLDAYQDVKEAGINPLLHYIQFGRNEGRFIEKA
ncbi:MULTISPECIES: hypothetical protein [unclassified Endozoicomonas]|uniref:hypothetical protein n=1 Tax=unclassified Endozoicomonas TaxID=2644528 RepID=UPI003BB74610